MAATNTTAITTIAPGHHNDDNTSTTATAQTTMTSDRAQNTSQALTPAATTITLANHNGTFIWLIPPPLTPAPDNDDEGKKRGGLETRMRFEPQVCYIFHLF